MSKPGRNELCPCGSGKKYKKCCLEKDIEKVLAEIEEEQNVEEWEPEEDELKYVNNDCDYSDESETVEIVTDDEDEYENGEKDEYDDTEDEEYDDRSVTDKIESVTEKITKKAHPVITEAEEKLVDKWWDEYDHRKKPGEIRHHIEQFMRKHPQLVENLELEHEVLFELGAKYTKAGMAGEYIDFLLYIRKEFPATYERNAGYYDRDIIAWLVAENRQGEIENYLGYFKQYPADFTEQLLEVVNLLRATDNTAVLMSLIEATRQQRIPSERIFGGDPILSPLMAVTVQKHVRPDVTNDDVSRFMDDLTEVFAPVEISKNVLSLRYWKTAFISFLRPYTIWPETIPKKKSQMEDRYDEITHNFTSYLHKKANISWVASSYYSTHLSDYFRKHIEFSNGKIQKQFDFSGRNIEKIVVSLSKRMMWLDCTTIISLLQAVYSFAAYLHECGNIDEQEKIAIQNECRRLYGEAYKATKDSIEALCFKKFPYLFETLL